MAVPPTQEGGVVTSAIACGSGLTVMVVSSKATGTTLGEVCLTAGHP